MASRLASRTLAHARAALAPPPRTAARGVKTTAWPPRATTTPAVLRTAPPAKHASTASDIEAELRADMAGASAPPAAPAAPAAPASASASASTPGGGGDPFAPSSADGALPDAPGTDWSKSYHGLSAAPFPKEVAEVLLAPIDPQDVEMKPDGLIYLPEIKYRRVLNRAFGPGGWGLAPRSETNVGPKVVSREYALVCLGRLVAVARGEQEYFDPNGIPTATEAVKSNALMRCCKDLGVASELWDPRFIREFKAKFCVEVFAEHLPTKKKKKLWRRKDQPKFDYPYKE
ncbi:mitochondrial genome maintenance MGM101-domain-containing protein [Phanerochaete sordida]|uniref:Mitochondrial genome maintenance protein MGM101 n=1 Tax=Phanerochaete sordida TaxID=48140 RepID=A0A9P3G1I2_9APHY|nr:mitochondrial genome maintenance MGM101-domain-containing protein [Phanerochaete sordida]